MYVFEMLLLFVLQMNLSWKVKLLLILAVFALETCYKVHQKLRECIEIQWPFVNIKDFQTPNILSSNDQDQHNLGKKTPFFLIYFPFFLIELSNYFYDASFAENEESQIPNSQVVNEYFLIEVNLHHTFIIHRHEFRYLRSYYNLYCRHARADKCFFEYVLNTYSMDIILPRFFYLFLLS